MPPEWSAKYKGALRSTGWDALREETFARQKELGRRPAGCGADAAARRDPGLGRRADDLKPVLARQMEVYAGFLEHTDHHVGRLVDALEDLGILDDTLVYYIIGDNGASAEGTVQGTFNELMMLNGAAALETTEFMASHIDEFGTPAAYNHYAVGWAHAMDTPYQWTKQVASHWGGTRNGTIVHWPKGIDAQGEMRSQFHHVIDIAPTVLDVAGLPEPTFVNGVEQTPLHGVSMRYAFDDASAAERRETQYFEMFCNRGIYHEGWTAVTRHSTPWVIGRAAPVRRRRVGALRHEHGLEPGARPRRGEAREAGRAPAPLPDRGGEVQRAAARRPPGRALQLRPRRAASARSSGNSQLLFGGMGRLSENSVLNLKNKSHAVTAEIEVPDGGADGVIIAQGGAFAGWSLYANDGKPKYCYNLVGLQRFKVEGDAQIPPGTHQVRMEFAYDGGGLAKGGTVTLYVDGAKVGEGRVEGDRADDLLRRRDLRRRLRHRVARERRLHLGGQPLQRAASTGCRSTSTRPPRISTT